MLALQNAPRFRFTLFSPLLGRRVLRYEPSNWEDLGLSLHRDRKTHGITTDYSAQLTFVKDGKAYLQRAYQAGSVDVEVRCLIEQYEPNEFSWQVYYQGRCNFTGAGWDATSFTVNVEAADFSQTFLSRDTVQVDLLGATTVSGAASPAPTPLLVELHSRALHQHYEARQKAPVETSTQVFGDEDNPSREQVLYFGFDTPVTNELGLGAVAGGFVAGDAASAVPIYVAKENGTFTFSLALSVHVEAHNFGQGPDFERVDGVCHFRINGSPATARRLQPDVGANVAGDYLGEILVPALTFTQDLVVGDEVYLYATYWLHRVGGLATGIRFRATLSATTNPGSYFTISAQTQTASSPAPGLLLHEALSRVCEALSEETDSFRSDFFGRTDSVPAYPADGPGSLTLYTGGFQVRGFPLRSAPAPASGASDLRRSLYATWQELFESLAAVYCLGSGLEWVVGRNGLPRQVVRVEPAAYYYPDEVVLDLTSAGPLVVKTKVSAADFYQVVEMGYQQWQAEQVNGLEEFNSTRQWTTPLTQVKNTYSQSSRLATAGMLLETARRQRYDATATTDDTRDATNFLVCLLRAGGGYTTERDQRLLSSTGLYSPATAYNVRLSPGRMLRRHGGVVRAGLLAAGQLRFTAGTGNTTMVSQLQDEPAPIREGGDVAVAELPPASWQPLTYAFTAPVGRLQLRALLARPRGKVRFLDDAGLVQAGWILEFSHAAKDQTGDFTLLASPSA